MKKVEYNFKCYTYGKKGKTACTAHHIRECELMQIVLDDLRRVTHFARMKERQFAAHINQKNSADLRQEMNLSLIHIWQVSSIPLRLLSKSQSRCWIAIFCFLRTSVQRGLLLCCRAHTRSLLGKPHTAATRASRCAPGVRHTRRVDRVDFSHGGKIGTFGTPERDQPLSVAAVDLDQNPVFP